MILGSESSVSRTLDSRQGIKSVEQAARLLEVFAEAGGPITLRALAERAHVSPSKAHRYLVSLMRYGLIHQDLVSGRYDLAAKSLELGLAALRRTDAVRFTTEAIIELNQRLDVMVALAVWARNGTTVISLYNRSELILANLSVGAILPLLRSASGRVFLAYLPRRATAAAVQQALQHSAEASPPSAIATLDDVEKLIARVRRHRLGMTKGDLVPSRQAIAAPVFDHQGAVVAVAAIVGVPNPADFHIAELRKSVDAVSRRLGFRDGDLPLVERVPGYDKPEEIPTASRPNATVASE